MAFIISVSVCFHKLLFHSTFESHTGVSLVKDLFSRFLQGIVFNCVSCDAFYSLKNWLKDRLAYH